MRANPFLCEMERIALSLSVVFPLNSENKQVKSALTIALIVDFRWRLNGQSNRHFKMADGSPATLFQLSRTVANRQNGVWQQKDKRIVMPTSLSASRHCSCSPLINLVSIASLSLSLTSSYTHS
jgi:hypothetical protein